MWAIIEIKNNCDMLTRLHMIIAFITNTSYTNRKMDSRESIQ